MQTNVEMVPNVFFYPADALRKLCFTINKLLEYSGTSSTNNFYYIC